MTSKFFGNSRLNNSKDNKDKKIIPTRSSKRVNASIRKTGRGK
ncbi:MAG: hypothetical protein P8M03_08375 [Flavobacteriaceae bacterium]|nr:hypothetical protein [Flavobacteriaceae bacterium]